MTDETPTHTDQLETAAATVATDVAHDAERDTRHGLAHLEDEFISHAKTIAALTTVEARKLLAWMASKLHPVSKG